MAKGGYVSPVYEALIYGALGDRSKELEFLVKGYQDESEYLLWLTIDPIFDSVRNSPWFTELVRKVGVSAAGSESSHGAI